MSFTNNVGIQSGTITVTNQKEEEKGSLTVEKRVLYNGVPDRTAASKTITVGLYRKDAAADTYTPVKHGTPADNWTETITLDANGAGSATFNELDLDTYYVFELGDDRAPVTGVDGTVNGVRYTVTYTDNGPTLTPEALSATVNATKAKSGKPAVLPTNTSWTT